MSFLNELKKERESLLKTQVDTFEKVFEQCLKSIKFLNKNGKTSMVYEIPVFVSGCPLVDQRECGKFLVQKLKELKLNVNTLKETKLFIDWG
jgi:hypothetical protein